MKFYIDFVALTTEQYEHCTLEEKLSVYVQHRPNAIVGFLQELIEHTRKLEASVIAGVAITEALQKIISELRDRYDDNIDEKNHD